ncbi:cell division protein FtsB [Achromobacter xylosoxidans]|uniref:cell division protein FtsB n=5 Tax=Achromobacter TaxID=222 RepID=UPI0022B8B1C7|nr:cell division protein FtsB [Achromobacter xylosoxidans]MCZ8440026.1 cell division protein FtsB [Achromobacter xylosoxidans]
MRLLFLVLFVLVGLIQYPLWLGKGGWFKVWDLQRQVAAQRETNEGLRARNAALEAEVRDLDNGSGAIEERARGELGMMREGEVFVHILPQNTQPPAGGASLVTDAAARPPATPTRASAPATPPRPAARPATGASGGNAGSSSRH